MTQIPLLKKRVSISLWLRLIAFIVLIMTGLAIVWASPLKDFLAENSLMSLVTEMRGVWWTPLLLIGLYTLLAILGLQTGPLMVGGALFGPFYGSIYNITGLVTGAACSFMIATLLGREFVIRVTGERLRRVENLFERHGFWPLVQTRFLPIPFAVVNFGAALTGVRPSLFLIAAVVGLIPSTLIHTYFIATLLESGGRERAIMLGLYAAIFVIFNILISALWIKGKHRQKILTFGWLTAILRRLIWRLDSHLRRKQGIFEFWDHPHCIFRSQVTQSDRPLCLHDEELPVGSRVLELHFWNDHIISAPEKGTAPATALLNLRLVRESFFELVPRLKTDHRMAGVMAVGGPMPLFFGSDNYPAEKIFARLGFHVAPFQGSMGFWVRLGKQLHSWMMMWAYNPKAMKNRNLFQLRWADCWMATDEFIRLHASAKSGDDL